MPRCHDTNWDVHNSRNSLGQYIQSKLHGWWQTHPTDSWPKCQDAMIQTGMCTTPEIAWGSISNQSYMDGGRPIQLIPDLNAKMPWYKLGCARVRSLLDLQKDSWQRVCCYKGLWELHPFFSLTLPLSLQEFQGIVWAIVKGLGLEGPSCQYLKMEVGGNVVVDDLYSPERLKQCQSIQAPYKEGVQ